VYAAIIHQTRFGGGMSQQTDDFTNILGATLNKSLVRGWDAAPVTYPRWCAQGSLSDFKTADLAKLSDAERIHVLVEAKKRAFADRERYGADPRFETVPLDRILSDAHADAQAATISMTQASTVDLNVPMAAGDTTYFCVVDSEGNCVSGIQSLNSGYGSGITAGDTGILMNNRMAYWHLAPTHANRLIPGKRVRHTMNAPMVFKDGKLWAALGTPGAGRS
jgi:gamma-glutamyltranspeptidase/glutathione hydrolase